MPGAIDRAKESFNNLAGSVAGALAPAMEHLAGGAEGAFEAFQKLPEPLQNIVVYGGLAAAAWARFGDSISGLRDKIGAGGIAGGTVALAGVAAVFETMAKNAADAAKANDEFKSSLAQGNDLASQQANIKATADEIARLEAEYHRMADGAGGFARDLEQLFNPFDDNKIDRTRRQVAGLGDDLGEMRRKATHFEEVGSGVAHALGISADAAQKLVLASQVSFDTLPFQDAVAGVMDYTTSLHDGTPAAQDFNEAMDGTGDVTKSAAEQFKDLQQAIKGYIDSVTAGASAQDDFQSDMNDLNDAVKAVKENGQGAFDGPSDSAIDFREKMRGVLSDAGALIEEWQRQGVQGDDLKGRIFLLSQNFRDQAEAAGVPIPVIDDLIGKIYGIPTSHNTNVTATDNATRVFESIAAALRANIPLGATVTVNGQVGTWRGPGLDISGHAAGGMMSEGWNWVGERGPELVNKKGSIVQVQSAEASRGFGSSGMMNVNLVLNERTLGSVVVDLVRRHARAAG